MSVPHESSPVSRSPLREQQLSDSRHCGPDRDRKLKHALYRRFTPAGPQKTDVTFLLALDDFETSSYAS
eukprot:1910582-Pleurochrysis_carterae.AAC.4